MKPKDAKIRVIALSNDESTNQKLDAAAKEKIEGWQEKHKEEIKKTSDAKQIEFDEIAHQAKEPEQISVKLEHNMTVPESDKYLPNTSTLQRKGFLIRQERVNFLIQNGKKKLHKMRSRKRV